MFDYSETEKIVLPLMFLGMLLIAVILGLLLRKASYNIRMIPLFTVACILIISEIVKQIYSIINGYSLFMLPLHFCSFLIVWYAFAIFGKGKLRQAGLALSFVSSLLMMLCFYSFPHEIIGSATDHVFKNFYTFHTFFFHHLAILFGLLITAMRVYSPKKIDFLSVTIGMFAYFVLAMILAHSTQTNFLNLLSGQLDIMQNVLDSVGVYVYDIIVFVTGTFALLLILLIRFLFKSKNKKLTNKYKATL